ncbi:MAG: hypothetical protein WC683_04385 [bacterium]
MNTQLLVPCRETCGELLAHGLTVDKGTGEPISPVIDTYFVWLWVETDWDTKDAGAWIVVPRHHPMHHSIPAPTFAEIWGRIKQALVDRKEEFVLRLDSSDDGPNELYAALLGDDSTTARGG